MTLELGGTMMLASLLPWAACASVTDSFLSRSDPINAFDVAEPATIP